jgi:hypothetical protein
MLMLGEMLVDFVVVDVVNVDVPTFLFISLQVKMVV